MKKSIYSLLLLFTMVIFSALLTSCGDDEPESSNNQTIPETPDLTKDYLDLLGYWINEDESCVLQFQEQDNSCKIISYVPKLKESTPGGKGYLSWESNMNINILSFTMIVFGDAHSCPAIDVAISSVNGSRMKLVKRESSNSDYNLSSNVFIKISTSGAQQVLEKGWNPLYLKPTGEKSGYEYVDLGLSVNWAVHNFYGTRQISPIDYGGYYAFGELNTKSSYTESNYQFQGKSLQDLRDSGVIDRYNELTSDYDCVSQSWGRYWMIPSEDEISELISRCTWYHITIDGINGSLVIGPSGNSIFLPAAGGKIDNDSKEINKILRYGSRTLGKSGRSVMSQWSDEKKPSLLLFVLNAGYSIRPVVKK